MTVAVRHFRPPPPRLREFRSIAFFAVIVAVLVYAAVRDGTTRWLPPAGGAALLVAGGLWLIYRWRTGQPLLTVDGAGLTYRRGGRERSARWEEVAGIEIYDLLDRMRFIIPGGSDIMMFHIMQDEAGVSFTMVQEDYWTSPDDDGLCRA